MTTENTFIVLFSIATAVAIAVRRSRVPYAVALVVVGLVLGSLRVIEPPHLTQELLFALFLPGLLFEAAFNLDARDAWKNRLAIGSLAVPGVVVAIGVAGAITTAFIATFDLAPDFSLRYGFVFGALVAATDPIAVVGLFKSLDVPARLAALVEGESLLNDGTSIVVLGLLLAYATGTTTSAGALLGGFFTIAGGGAIVGGAVGLLASRVTKHVDDAMIEITLTTIAAYGSFVAAEQFHVSGVIATVAAGMVCGNYGREVGMSPATRLAVDAFWEYVAFALNSIVFLLIGFEVRFPTLAASWEQILIAYVAVTAGRAGVVFLVALILGHTSERMPRRWSSVLVWGGMRGALSMVLALALPFTFPHRDLLVTMTYGVVVASLLVQGLTMPWLLRVVLTAPAHGATPRADGAASRPDGATPLSNAEGLPSQPRVDDRTD